MNGLPRVIEKPSTPLRSRSGATVISRSSRSTRSSRSSRKTHRSRTTQTRKVKSNALSMGKDTYEISPKLFLLNRSKLIRYIKNQGIKSSIVYLESGQSTTRYDSDHEPVFRQESYFHYCFGVREPDWAGLIHCDTGKTVLFVPKVPKEDATIMGRIPSLEEHRSHYSVDKVLYNDDLDKAEYLDDFVKAIQSKEIEDDMENNTKRNLANNTIESDTIKLSLDQIIESPPKDKETDQINVEKDKVDDSSKMGKLYNETDPTILLMNGVNSDSNKPFQNINNLPNSFQPYIDTTILYPILAECRVTKSQHELSLLRHVTELTSISHVHTMKQAVPGSSEYKAEATFQYVAYYHFGARLTGYTSISACGPNVGVLHYGHAGAPNDGQIKDGALCLHDMGAEYFGYGSAVACTFPANGIFTAKQKIMYEGVLNAQRVVIGMIKPGLSWLECHKAAEGEILKMLIDLGVVMSHGKSIKDLVDMRMGAVFMPHGIGHLIGIDTHDVGGYLEDKTPKRSELPGLKSLRTSRILEKDMTLTVEPGCYFIKHLMDESMGEDSPLKSFLNKDTLTEFIGFGGVRLKDVVLVTEDGCDNFTICPRTVEEVEYVKAGGKWPPEEDEAKELLRSRLCVPTPLTGYQSL